MSFSALLLMLLTNHTHNHNHDPYTHKGTSKTNFNCLYNTLTTIQLPYGLTLTSPVSEKGPLLPPRGQVGYYKLHNQGPLHSTGNRQQIVSSLTFVPQISIHKGAVFKCQVSYTGKDKVVVERISERFTVLGKEMILLPRFPFPFLSTFLLFLMQKKHLYTKHMIQHIYVIPNFF